MATAASQVMTDVRLLSGKGAPCSVGFRVVGPGGTRRGLHLRGAIVLLGRAVFQRDGKFGFDFQEANR